MDVHAMKFHHTQTWDWQDNRLTTTADVEPTDLWDILGSGNLVVTEEGVESLVQTRARPSEKIC